MMLPIAGRCGKCEACLYVESTRKIVLAAANPPFSHVTDGEVDMWNNALKNSPCENPPREEHAAKS